MGGVGKGAWAALLIFLLAIALPASAKPKPKVPLKPVPGGGGGEGEGEGDESATDPQASIVCDGCDKSPPGNQVLTGWLPEWTEAGAVPNGSCPVFSTVSVNKIGSIDSASGTFWFDFYIYISWRDDRQDPVAFDISTAWWPQPELINKNNQDETPSWSCSFGEGPPKFMASDVPTSDGIWSLCQIRHQVTLDAQLLLYDFPFDTQYADITIESFSMQEDQMHFRPVKGIEGGLLPKEGSQAVSGWTIVSSTVTTSAHSYDTFEEVYDQLKLTLELTRLPDYYITRYVWGVVFLVAMALLVLFVPGDCPDRLGFVQASFFGIVSWQFILVESAPVTGYNTKLDNFMLISMVVVFITYVWNSVSPSHVWPFHRTYGRCLRSSASSY
jgi:hypothetical protein